MLQLLAFKTIRIVSIYGCQKHKSIFITLPRIVINHGTRSLYNLVNQIPGLLQHLATSVILVIVTLAHTSWKLKSVPVYRSPKLYIHQ